MISIVEYSILNDSVCNDGLNVCMIEIFEIFIISVDNVDVIKKVIFVNYGYVMLLVVEYFLNCEGEVIKWFYVEYDWFKK